MLSFKGRFMQTKRREAGKFREILPTVPENGCAPLLLGMKQTEEFALTHVGRLDSAGR